MKVEAPKFDRGTYEQAVKWLEARPELTFTVNENDFKIETYWEARQALYMLREDWIWIPSVFASALAVDIMFANPAIIKANESHVLSGEQVKSGHWSTLLGSIVWSDLAFESAQRFMQPGEVIFVGYNTKPDTEPEFMYSRLNILESDTPGSRLSNHDFSYRPNRAERRRRARYTKA